MNPRAIAALCSLRRGPRDTEHVMHAIGDVNVFETMRLLADMRRARLATQLHSQSVDHRWYIAELGAEYLNSNGIKYQEWADCRFAQQAVTP